MKKYPYLRNPLAASNVISANFVARETLRPGDAVKIVERRIPWGIIVFVALGFCILSFAAGADWGSRQAHPLAAAERLPLKGGR